jgi:hypothetical protein
MSAHLKLVTPNTENRTVTPKRRPNAELRTREYLTDAEVAALIAKGNRYGLLASPTTARKQSKMAAPAMSSMA